LAAVRKNEKTKCTSLLECIINHSSDLIRKKTLQKQLGNYHPLFTELLNQTLDFKPHHRPLSTELLDQSKQNWLSKKITTSRIKLNLIELFKVSSGQISVEKSFGAT